MNHYLTTLLFLLFFVPAFSQCEVDEVELTMILYTDAWGYETYWELVPSGNACGEGTIISGGNEEQVGCNGGGEQDAGGGNGYDNNSVIEIDPLCLTIGQFYDLIFVDDWGDGGLFFEIFEDGVLTHQYGGGGIGNVWTFEAGNPMIPENDAPCNASLIEVDGDNLLMSSVGALSPVGEVSPGGGWCALFGVWCEGGVSNSIWARFIAPEDGALIISTCNPGTNFDTQIALWQATDCNDWETYSLVSSNDDMIGGCGNGAFYSSRMFASCLDPGEEYLVQIDGYFGQIGDVELSVGTYSDGLFLEPYVDNVDCPNVKGDDTGGITLLVYGTGTDVDIQWTGPNGFVGEGTQIFNLIEGDYNVVVTDACQDVIEGTFTVSVPEPLLDEYTIGNPTCETSPDGIIELDVSGGTAPYTFLWSGPDSFESTDEDVFEVTAGVYELVITDNNGCQYDQTILLEPEEDFAFSLGPDTLICQDEYMIISGPSGLNYEWQNGSEDQFQLIEGEELGPGTYTYILTGSDDLGCTHTDAIIITISACTGVEENFLTDLVLFPNPTQDRLTIAGLENQRLTIRIFDSRGSLIDVKSNVIGENLEWDVSQYASGLYHMMLSDGDRTLMRKFEVR